MKIIIITSGILFITSVILGWAGCCLPLLRIMASRGVLGMILAILGAMLTATLLTGTVIVGSWLINYAG